MHVGSGLYNLGQSFVTDDEFGGSGWRRAVLEGADLAICAADPNLDCSKQHLSATRPVRYRSFHQTHGLLLWNHDDGAHRPGGRMWCSPASGLRFSVPHRDAGGRPIPPKDFRREPNDFVEPPMGSGKLEPLEDPAPRPEENAVDLGTFIAATDRQVINSDHPNPSFGEHPRRTRIKVGVVFDESVHIPTA